MDATEPWRSRPTPGGAEEIRLDGVSKVFADGTVGVAQLDLTFAAGELSVLVGPSGCGKTTTMKMINRLIEPSTGRILLGDAHGAVGEHLADAVQPDLLGPAGGGPRMRVLGTVHGMALLGRALW